MAKITRRELARGTKLQPGHIYTPLDDIASEMGSPTNLVQKEQLQVRSGSFRVNFHIPVLDARFWHANPSSPWYVPFVMPPTQELFSSEAIIEDGTPVIRLREVDFSFDTRGEACMITSQWADGKTAGTSVEEGKMMFDRAEGLSFRIALTEKAQEYFNRSIWAEPLKPGRELFGVTIPPEAYASPDFRQNPIGITNLNAVINPYNTMMFSIYAPGLVDDYGVAGSRDGCLPSIQISMKFSVDYMEPTARTDYQNLPDQQDVTKAGKTIAISTPLAGTGIEADTADGVDTNIAKIDQLVEDGYRGGLDRFGLNPADETLLDDTCYEIIAVPMMQNGHRNEYSALSTSMTRQPFAGSTPFPGPIGDWRRIPIHHPMTIHHVFVAHNFQPSQGMYVYDAPQAPQSASLHYEVGVGLGHGLRSDTCNYQQVAYHDYVGAVAGWTDHRIDRIFWPLDTTKDLDPDTNYEWDIHQIPLVGNGGVGYYAQGKPVFVGKGITPTFERSDIDGHAPYTEGAEQWIEVRMTWYDVNGLSSVGAGEDWEIFCGQGGHWVYIIGTKPVVDGARR